MKRAVSLVVAVMCLLCTCVGGLSATAMGNQAVYVFSRDSEGYLMARQEGEMTFWEAPCVLTGQTVGDGVITLKNETDRAVNFTLASVALPYGDEAALTYLDAVTLVIRQGDREVYHGPFTRLMDADRAPIVFADVSPGESRELHLSVSCRFTYSGDVPSYQSLVWTFAPTMGSTATKPSSPPMQPAPTTDWLMVANIAAGALGVLAATCAVVAVVRWIRKKVNR